MRLEISGVSVELIRKKIKTVNICVLPPDGRVRVSAPWFVSQAQIAELVEKNLPWIERQQQRLSPSEAAERQFVTGEAVLLWGREYTLRIAEAERGGSVTLSGGEALMSLRPGSDIEKRRELIKQWYRDTLSAAVGEALPSLEAATGLHPDSWQLKAMKTRWGSCNTRTKKIWLSLYLCQKPPECLEYVLIHELCHLRVGNHGAEFKALMDSFLPDWRQRRKLLNAPDDRMIYF